MIIIVNHTFKDLAQYKYKDLANIMSMAIDGQIKLGIGGGENLYD